MQKSLFAVRTTLMLAKLFSIPVKISCQSPFNVPDVKKEMRGIASLVLNLCFVSTGSEMP